MKVTKQARAALFVALLVISVLPGCGKKKDEGVVGGVAVGGVLLPGQVSGSHVVSGQVQISQTGAFSGTLGSQGVAAAGGTPYTRSNGYDSVTLYISGLSGYGAGGYANATAVVNLSAGTVQACSGGYGYYPGYVAPTISVANVQFYLNTVSPNGQIAYSVRVTTTNG